MGSDEDRRYLVLWQNNHTRAVKTKQLCRASWRRKWSLCMHTTCVHAPHTHLKDSKAEWPNPQTLNTPPLLKKTQKFVFVQNPSKGQLSQQSQHHTPSMELHYSNNSCQQFSVNIYSTHPLTSSRFWLAHRLLSFYLSICVPTYMHNTGAHSGTQPNEQGEWGG